MDSQMNRPQTPQARPRETGFSLIELMIAMAIAMIITGALMVLFTNVLKTNREQFKAAQQIENGRFATDLLANNIQLAGFYGEFSVLPSAASFTALPDPCDVSPTSTGTGRLKEGTITKDTTDSPLAFYIQGYNSSGTTVKAAVPTVCANWIDSASIAAGSDILVVRRLDTIPLIDPSATTPVTSATPVNGQVYVQAVNGTADVQYGNASAAIDACKNAKGVGITGTTGTCAASTGGAALTRKDFSQAATGSPAARPRVAAYIRALHTDIYYVSPCRSGTGGGLGKCTSADDTIPTLKRLELTTSGGSATMTVVPLVEGIEFFKVRYGLDNGATSGITGAQINGTVDQVVATPATIADWQNVVMVEVRIISRNLETSVIGSATANTDTKSYDLGSGITYTPSGTAALYKRHAFTQKIFLQNIGGRRES